MSLVLVSSMHKQCSLPLRADCCGGPVTSAVRMPNGDLHWRCYWHEGMVSAVPALQWGEIVESVPDKTEA